MRLTIKRSQRRTKVTLTFLSDRSTESILNDIEYGITCRIPAEAVTGIRIQETAYTVAVPETVIIDSLSVDSLETTRDRA